MIWQEEEGGAPRRIRTADPFITNEVLYQLSYWGYATVRLNDRGAVRKAESVLSDGWQGRFLMR